MKTLWVWLSGFFSGAKQKLALLTARRQKIEENWKRLLAIGPTIDELREILEKVPELHERAWRERIRKKAYDYSVFFDIRYKTKPELLPEDLKVAIVAWAIQNEKCVQDLLGNWKVDSERYERGEIEARCLLMKLEDSGHLLSLGHNNPELPIIDQIGEKIFSRQLTIHKLLFILNTPIFKNFHARVWKIILADPKTDRNEILVRILHSPNKSYISKAAEFLLMDGDLGHGELQAIIYQTQLGKLNKTVAMKAARRFLGLTTPEDTASDEIWGEYCDGLRGIAQIFPQYGIEAVTRLVASEKRKKSGSYAWWQVLNKYSSIKLSIRENAATQLLAQDSPDPQVLQVILENIPKYREAVWEKLFPLMRNSPNKLGELLQYTQNEPWFGRYATEVAKLIPPKDERQIIMEELTNRPASY